MLGRQLYDDTLSLQSIIERLGELGVRVDPVREGEAIEPGVEPDGARPDFVRLLEVKDALCERMRRHVERAHPILDQRTQTALASPIHNLARQLPVLRECLSSASDDVGALRMNVGNGLDLRTDSAGRIGQADARWARPPARDGRFRVVDETPTFADCAAASDPTDRLAYELHSLLMNLEIPAMELCAENIVYHAMAGWEFVLDMARQVDDEARHSLACIERLVAIGGTLGAFPVDHRLWRMASGLPLEVRLAVHQRGGEWMGVDAGCWLLETHAENGDEESAALYAYMAADEFTHVAIGNKWLDRLLPTPEAHQSALIQAEARRREFRAGDDLPRPFPFQQWACERSSFAAEDVARLAEGAKTTRPEVRLHPSPVISEMLTGYDRTAGQRAQVPTEVE